MLIRPIAKNFTRKVVHVCLLTLLAISLQSDKCVCGASNLDRIQELTRQFLPDTLSKIIESIEAKSRKEGSQEVQEPSIEREQDRQIVQERHLHRDRQSDQDSRAEDRQDRDKQFSDVERNNEEFRQLEERVGHSTYQRPSVYYQAMQAEQQEPREDFQEKTDSIETPRNEDREQGPRDESYEKNEFIREQISKLSADMFKLDEPLFDDEQPHIKRVETQWRGNDDGEVKYNIDEIVDKVRDRLREDFEQHGYGYLLSDTKKKPNVRDGPNTQNRNNAPKHEEKEQGEVYNYAQNNQKETYFQDVQDKRPYPYNNQEKREVISQENVRNERPDSRFQVLNHPKPKYEMDDTAREIDRVRATTRGAAPVYKKDVDVPEEFKKQDTDLYKKKPIGKKGHDSYEDYQIPQKEANIYASEEAPSPKPNREQHNNNNGNKRGEGSRQVTPQRLLVKRIKTTTEPVIDYTEMTMANTEQGVHAVTEIMKWEYDEGTLREKSQTRARTVLPTKKKFKSVSPNYYISQPTVVEKYNFAEPIPVKEQAYRAHTHTGRPTIKKRFKLSSPNYYISQPTVVEKYNFEEPIPVNEQVAEDHGPKIGMADIGDIAINNRGKKLKRLLRTS